RADRRLHSSAWPYRTWCEHCAQRTAMVGAAPRLARGVLCRLVQVRRQMRWCVRDALEPWHRGHVDDVRLPIALDDVDAVEVDAKRLATAPGDFAQLRRWGELLSVFLLLGLVGDARLDTEERVPVREDLPSVDV